MKKVRLNDEPFVMDSVLQLLYSDESNLLSLCSSFSGCEYNHDDIRHLIVTDDMVYIALQTKAYMFYLRQNMVVCPNVPVISFLALGTVLSYLDRSGFELSEMIIPEFKSFYCGEESLPAVTEHRLSDHFIHKDENTKCELVTRMYNLNHEDNRRILDSCKSLREYMEFIGDIRECCYGGMSVFKAVETVSDKCIEAGVLAEFLEEHRTVLKYIMAYYQESGFDPICSKKEVDYV